MGKIGKKRSNNKRESEISTVKSGKRYEDDSVGFVQNSDMNIEERRKPDSMAIDVVKQERKIKKWALESKKIISEGKYYIRPNINTDLNKNLVSFNNVMTKQYGSDSVIEIADSSFRVRKVNGKIGEPVAEFSDMMVGRFGDKKNIIVETADDDRVIGIPYTIANIGADKYYIINGRVYSGWAMWFGLQSIRSPEDYARNVDLTYNVPFVWAGFNLKAHLSLGASFDITHGTEEEETPEEAFVNEIVYGKLKINLQKLTKTSFHLDMYGNSYWHIRRDAQGFPDKITVLQPERIKVFLDPKTTKVLYYIYLPPVLAGMALTPYPNIRENPNILHGPALTYPTPIIIDPGDIIHFMENNYTEYPYGLSACKAMLDPCTARLDINVLAPMIFKRYAKPMIHWKLDPMTPFQLTKGQIENYIDGMKSALENMEPMSDPVTSIRWSASPIGAAQGKAELLTILQDLDNQIFACMSVPESYFKPQGTADTMIGDQDKVFMAMLQERQQRVGELIQDKVIKPIIDRYDQMINLQLQEAGEDILPQRAWNQYPTIQWRETFKQDQVTTIQNTMALLQAGLVDHARAARRVGEKPPQQSAELSRKMDLNKVMEEVQIEQANLQMMQTRLQEMDTMQVIQMGGTAAMQQAQMEAQMQAEGGAPSASGGNEKSGGKSGKQEKTPSEKSMDEYDENARYKVTFTNRNGKKQTELMKGSTLKKQKSSGLAIQNIVPVGNKAEDETAKNVKRALG